MTQWRKYPDEQPEPEKDGYYIACYSNRHGYRFVNKMNFTGEYWTDDNGYTAHQLNIKVLYWMPFPEAPHD